MLEGKCDGTSDLNIRTSTLSKNGKENARVRANEIAGNLMPAAKCLIARKPISFSNWIRSLFCPPWLFFRAYHKSGTSGLNLIVVE